ncbi:MAG: serine/threonine protein kinase, partial [Planctomycetes bacterium]|nr:serine/threonine protein kinase [Planctomycetota bacterium]
MTRQYTHPPDEADTAPTQPMPHGLADPDRTRIDDTASLGGADILFVQSVTARSPTDTVHLHHGEVWGGDFKLGPLLGRGGMGAVYKGRQLSLDRPVAIKALKSHLSDNPDLTARFEQEAKVVARINSPHVVHVHVFGKHRNHHFLAMELVEGEDLNKKLKSGWRPTPDETVELMIQAAKGLMAAAERGIVHRDIKPGNMMLTSGGLLKLMDFGLARLAHHVGSATSTGVVMGTGAYMSPEQCQGRICDIRSDIYSLGVVFYELLTGRRPFDGESYMEMFCQHIEKDPVPPSQTDPTIPAAVETVVLTCLAKKADERYQTPAALLEDLQRIRDHQRPLAAGSARLPRPAALRAVTVVTLVVLLLAAVGAGWWLAVESTQREPAKTTATPRPPIAPPPAPATTAAAPTTAATDLEST